MRDFSGFHGDLFGIFGRESPYSATISGMKVFTQKKDRVSKVYPQGTFSRMFSAAIRLFRKKFAAGNELFCKVGIFLHHKTLARRAPIILYDSGCG
ncbi:MAG: hypothetical protein WB284_11560 [Methanoregula sp.]